MRHKLKCGMWVAAVVGALWTGAAQAQYEHVSNGWDHHGYSGGCDSCSDSSCDGCGPACGDCGSCNLCCDPCRPCKTITWQAGVEAVIVRPQFEDNTGIIINNSDDDTFSNFQTMSFDYGFNASPRVWIGWESVTGLGGRVRFWTYDQSADTLMASPSPDGFGTVFSPLLAADNRTFVPSTSIPTDRLIANADLDVDVIDLEGTKHIHFDCWSLLASGGVRFASYSQNYNAELRNANNQVTERSHFGHSFSGVGPTFSLEARRPVTRFLTAYTSARGAVLFGDSDMASSTEEDLLLANPFVTLRTADRDDVLPIGELQIGGEWTRRLYYGGHLYFRGAFEGQFWGGAGAATTESGDLGFLGFSASLGINF